MISIAILKLKPLTVQGLDKRLLYDYLLHLQQLHLDPHTQGSSFRSQHKDKSARLLLSVEADRYL